MNESDRGQWELATDSLPMRLYGWWEHMGGIGPRAKDRPIDLCHFVRVLVFWVWLRWFFCSRFEPWAWVFSAGGVVTLVWAWTRWPDEMNEIAIWAGVGVAIMLAVFGIVILIERYTRTGIWKLQREKLLVGGGWVLDQVDRFIFDPIFVAIEAAAPKIGRFLIRPIIWRVNPLAILLTTWLVASAILWPGSIGVVYLWGLGIIVLVSVVLLSAYGAKTALDIAVAKRAEKKKDEEPDETPARPPGRVARFLLSVGRGLASFGHVAWLFLKAKKYRMCPLIVTPKREEHGA